MSLNAEEFVKGLFQEDASVDELHHVYDPAKAREYYLRVRQLKGRKKADVKPGFKSSFVASIDKTKKPKAVMEVRTVTLKIRLQKLEDLLDKLMKEGKTSEDKIKRARERVEDVKVRIAIVNQKTNAKSTNGR